jgi:hypothetical protein
VHGRATFPDASDTVLLFMAAYYPLKYKIVISNAFPRKKEASYSQNEYNNLFVIRVYRSIVLRLLYQKTELTGTRI